MNEEKTAGKGYCMEVISSTLDHIRGNLEFKNCGGCPCSGDCFCAGYVDGKVATGGPIGPVLSPFDPNSQIG